MKNTIIGLLLDIPDFLGFGMIPILGDIIDVLGIIYFTKVLGVGGVMGALELVPGLDELPIFTFLGVYADFFKKGEK